MRLFLNTAVKNFCLIAILLWAQIAAAQHNIEHSLGHQAPEVCEVYASADNAKIIFSIGAPAITVEFGLEAILFDTNYALNTTASTPSARAPPTFLV